MNVKICVIGLCHLLQMPDNPAIAPHAQQIVPSLILLFDGLKRAYAARWGNIAVLPNGGVHRHFTQF